MRATDTLLTRRRRRGRRRPERTRRPASSRCSTTAASLKPTSALPLNFLIDGRGDAILGLAASRQVVDDALAAWTNVETASIILADGGLTDDLTAPCDGPHKIRFNDPENEIPPPVNCTGTLGIGGLCVDTAESKIFNDMTFQHATRAGLTLADGWEGCSVWTACNIGEIATHEIGHAIGLGHSSENGSSRRIQRYATPRCSSWRTSMAAAPACAATTSRASAFSTRPQRHRRSLRRIRCRTVWCSNRTA